MVGRVMVLIWALLLSGGNGLWAGSTADFAEPDPATWAADLPTFNFQSDLAPTANREPPHLDWRPNSLDYDFLYPLEARRTDWNVDAAHRLGRKLRLPDSNFWLTFSRDGRTERRLLPSTDANIWKANGPTDVPGASKQIGVDVDFSDLLAVNRDAGFYAMTLINWLPTPVTLDFGVRKAESPYSGFYGFQRDRELLLEGGFTAKLTDGINIGAEYRQRSAHFDDAVGFAWSDHDSWSVGMAFRPQNDVTISGGIYNFGDFLTSDDSNNFGMKIRFDF